MNNRIKGIKCVVWDLDDTLWIGTLSEGRQLALNEEVVAIMRRLDEMGVLQSIASKNNYDDAYKKLIEFGLAEFFLYPQINWNSKVGSIVQISKALNIGIDTIAFVDDQQIERDEVAHTYPEVLCVATQYVSAMLRNERFSTLTITDESRNRRKMYMYDDLRNQEEAQFQGSKEEFLGTLEMIMRIRKATARDLARIEELTVRTNQLNTTGYTYSQEQLYTMLGDQNYYICVAELEDRYGSYGIVGIAIVDKTKVWTIKLLLMSCRVMTKGVGTVLLNYLIQDARQANAPLYADYCPTERNRLMYITFKFNGFLDAETTDGCERLVLDPSYQAIFPQYLHLVQV